MRNYFFRERRCSSPTSFVASSSPLRPQYDVLCSEMKCCNLLSPPSAIILLTLRYFSIVSMPNNVVKLSKKTVCIKSSFGFSIGSPLDEYKQRQKFLLEHENKQRFIFSTEM